MGHIDKRDNGRWRARHRAPDGRERSKTFDRKADAERFLASVAVDRAPGDWLDPALGRVTFARWIEEWSSTTFNLRDSTRQRDLSIIRAHLLPRFGPMQLASITQSESED